MLDFLYPLGLFLLILVLGCLFVITVIFILASAGRILEKILEKYDM